jgi:hypothetical protein
VRGRIVLYNRAITASQGYGVMAVYRTRGAVEALELAQNAAAMAVMAYVLADMPEPLPRPGTLE